MTNTQTEWKAKEHANWTLATPGWKKHDVITHQGLTPVTERMLAAAAVGAGSRVLDIACGTGEPAIPAAIQVGPDGMVLATDFVEDMLAVARAKARERHLTNIQFARIDGEQLDVPSGFDAVLCRFGIMFMPDALACLKQACGALREGGRIAVATWAAPDRNPWLAVPLGAIKRHVDVPAPPPGAPGLFAYADPVRLRETLEGAGFDDVRLDEVPVRFTGFSTGLDYFRFITELSAPMTALVAKTSPETRAAIEADASAALEAFRALGSVTIDGVAWVASGRRAR